MRSIIKKIAAQGSLITPRNDSSNTVVGRWLASLFVLSCLLLVSSPATAATEPDTTLTNTVMVNYTVGTGAIISTGSSVSLTTSSRTPAQISFFSEFLGGDPLNVKPTSFSTDGSAGNWQGLSNSVQGNTPVIQTISFSAGEPLIVRLEDYDQNIDSSTIQAIIIDLGIGNTGDTERLLLTETAADSGVFAGVINLVDTSSVVEHNGELSVESLSEIEAKYTDREDQSDVTATVGIVDPSNIVFDSTTGAPVNGAIITLTYTGSSQGARVYDQFNGDWPSTVVSGAPVVASSTSRNIPMGQGEFQFPRVLGGDYELRVTPPVGYRYPSQQSQTQLAQFGAIANQVGVGSRGETFSIADALGAVLLNIPIDPFDGRFSVQKTVDQATASVGDELLYTVTAQNNDAVYALTNVVLKDTLPPGFRYIAGSAKNSSGTQMPESTITVDGRSLSFQLGTLIAGTSQKISYRVSVGAGSPKDKATNKVQGFSDDAQSNTAAVSVEMKDELMSTKKILIGRVYKGSCENTDEQVAIKNARLYLQDGRTVVTDSQGRWHLDGLDSGTHAIQLDESSLPAGLVVSPCEMTSRHVRQPHSQILNLKQGQIWQVDFHVAPGESRNRATGKTSPLNTSEAYQLPENPLALYGKDYTEKTSPGFEIVWPPKGHVPSISTLKVAVKYPTKQRLKVLFNGKKINPINLEGSDSNRSKTVSVMRWTGVDINQKSNSITAILEDKRGKEIKRITRYVHFTEYSTKAEIDLDASVLVADGIRQPVIAIRMTDEKGFHPRPRTYGFFTLEQSHWRIAANTSGPKTNSVALNKSQDGKYEYTVSDDGLVRIRLEPTARSGHVTINMPLKNGKREAVKAWLKPALRDWIMVGFVSGTVGYKQLSGNMQSLEDLGQAEGRYQNGEVSFFAKGRIKGDYLLTVAYDSAKEKGGVGDQLDGVVDPDAWYTLYGDEQQHQHETPSSSKLYLKLEKEQFYALFGDYATGMDVTDLGRYERVLHGLKSSYEGDKYEYTAFASETSKRSQRDEMQGDGTSGLYYLSRVPVSASEKITLETRDRDDLGLVIESRTLNRYSDYEIDYDAKSVFFKFPISGSDDAFNPIYIVVDYESEDENGEKALAIGGRLGVKALDDRLSVGMTYLREDGDDLIALDSAYQINENLNFKGELARSSTTVDASAWSADLEYRDQKWNARLFARQQETGFGLNQQSSLTEGERTVGVSVRYLIDEQQSIVSSMSQLDNLDNDNQRIKNSVAWHKTNEDSQLSIGFHHLQEQAAGVEKSSQTIRVGGSKAFYDGKLSLLTQLDKALDSDGSPEQNPDRLKLGLDYELSDTVTLYAEQELAKNDLTKTRNTRVGMKSNLWEGGNVRTDLVSENSDQGGGSARNYAVLGLSQHWKVNDQLHLDFNIDKSKSIDQLNYMPLSASGTTAINADDYLSVSLGAGWKHEDWSATARVEQRESDAATKRSLQYKAVRKLDDHYAVSKQSRIVDTQQANGDSKRQSKFGFSMAVRAKELAYTVLNQLDYINDTSVTSGIKSRRSKLINNLHFNRKLTKKLELNLHHGAKLTQTESDPEHWGLTDTLQVGARYDITENFDLGAQAGYLHHWDSKTRSDFAGVSIGVSPTKNMRVELGYNMEGFNDDDFNNENFTHQGPYINLNYLLDQSLLSVFDRKADQ